MRPTHRTRTHAVHPRFAHPIAVSSYGAAPSDVPFAVTAVAGLAGAAIGGAIQGIAYAYFLDAPIGRGAKVGAALTVALTAVGIGLKSVASAVNVRPNAATETPT